MEDGVEAFLVGLLIGGLLGTGFGAYLVISALKAKRYLQEWEGGRKPEGRKPTAKEARPLPKIRIQERAGVQVPDAPGGPRPGPPPPDITNPPQRRPR